MAFLIQSHFAATYCITSLTTMKLLVTAADCFTATHLGGGGTAKRFLPLTPIPCLSLDVTLKLGSFLRPATLCAGVSSDCIFGSQPLCRWRRSQAAVEKRLTGYNIVHVCLRMIQAIRRLVSRAIAVRRAIAKH